VGPLNAHMPIRVVELPEYLYIEDHYPYGISLSENGQFIALCGKNNARNVIVSIDSENKDRSTKVCVVEKNYIAPTEITIGNDGRIAWGEINSENMGFIKTIEKGKEVVLWQGKTNLKDYPCVMRFTDKNKLLVIREGGILMEFKGKNKSRSKRLGIRSAYDYQESGNRWMAIGPRGIAHGNGEDSQIIWKKGLTDGRVSIDATAAIAVTTDIPTIKIEEIRFGEVFPKTEPFGGPLPRSLWGCYRFRSIFQNENEKPFLIYPEGSGLEVLDVRKQKVVGCLECPDVKRYAANRTLTRVVAVSDKFLYLWDGIGGRKEEP